MGSLKELSPQQVVSCDTTCNGCGGGNPINAWGYDSSFGGQEPSGDYPYTSGTTQQTGVCKSVKADVVEDVGSTYKMIASQPSRESNMLAQIQDSPMSVCVDATLGRHTKVVSSLLQQAVAPPLTMLCRPQATMQKAITGSSATAGVKVGVSRDSSGSNTAQTYVALPIRQPSSLLRSFWRKAATCRSELSFLLQVLSRSKWLFIFSGTFSPCGF